MTYDTFEENVIENGLEDAAKRFYGIYRAFVVSTEDTTCRGFVKLRCPGVSSLPELGNPAVPIFPFGGYDYGIFFQPAVGEAVYVMFELGDINHPRYIGGWWACPNGNTELPTDIANPTNPSSTKIIKTPIGHGIVFEDGTSTNANAAKRVEIFSGSREQSGTPSLKLHRIVLNDKEGEKFVQIATEKLHEFTMDDTNQLIRLKSTGNWDLTLSDVGGFAQLTSPTGHTLRMDENAQTVSLGSALGNTYVISDVTNSHVIRTVAGRAFTMDDASTVISIIDPVGNAVSIGPSGISIMTPTQMALVAGTTASITATGALSLAANGISVNSSGTSATVTAGATTTTMLGGLASTVIGFTLLTLAGIAQLTVAGALTITAATIAITAGTIVLAGGANQMMTNVALALIASHTHPHGAGPGTATASTELADFTANPNNYLTQSTLT